MADVLPVMEQDELEFAELITLLHEYDVTSVLEVGVFQGGTLARFMDALPHVVVVGIDPRPMLNLHRWRNVVTGCSQDPDVRQRARSLNGGEHFDFVFIDGDHSYDGVREDWEWAKQTSRIVAFHDIHSVESCPDVVQFWRDLVATQDWNMVHEIAYDNARNGIGVVWPK